MKIQFYSNEEKYIDKGPTLSVKKLHLLRDRLLDERGNELAQFLINSWSVNVVERETQENEVYENATISDENKFEQAVKEECQDETYADDFRKNPRFKAALHYLRLGWSVVALCPRDHYGVGAEHRKVCRRPDKFGKVPVDCRWRLWQQRPPTEQELEDQFRRHPSANVGVVMGKVSNLVSVDIDGPTEKALEELAWLDLSDTLTFDTHRGQRLVYFLPDDMKPPANSCLKFSEGQVELLSEGRISVMPPSLHCKGKKYTWQLNQKALTTFQPWKPLPLPSHASSVEGVSMAMDGGIVIHEGLRNRTLFRAASALRRFGAAENEIRAALKNMNTRCEPPLEEEELCQIARSAASRYSPNL